MRATLKNIQQATLMVDPTANFTEQVETNQVTIHSDHAYQIAINCQVLFKNVVKNNSNWVTVTIGDKNENIGWCGMDHFIDHFNS